VLASDPVSDFYLTTEITAETDSQEYGYGLIFGLVDVTVHV
jgi:hypothetical protein